MDDLISTNLHDYVAWFQYASVTKDGEKYMSAEDFIQGYIGLLPKDQFNTETVKLLANTVDTTKDG